MDTRQHAATSRLRRALTACALAAAIAIALAGAAAPWYAREVALWLTPTLVIGAILIAVALIASLRAPVAGSDRTVAEISKSSLGAPIELAPEELRRQLETLRHTQGELLLAKQTAEAAMMAKGEFLATMSHEIRTPLNGVLPLLELVLSTKLAADQREYLATAYASSRELLRIVDAILDYSKLDAERLELETTGLNLRELVDGVAQLMQRAAEAKGLRLSVTIEPNVRLAVRGDPVRLRQVLTNLVSNAVKFTERGGVQIQVSKRGETRDHHDIVFAIRDSGIGIAPGTAAKLFKPFSQADASTTRVFGGSGLGLAICKRLVDLMNGHIGVKSEPGKGSLFWFSVPLLKAVGDVQVRRDLDGLRALAMVEDDVLLRRLQSFSSALGIELTPVRLPADALARLRASASMGERWRHALLVIDTTSFRPLYAGLVRNVFKDSTLGHVRVLLLGQASGAGSEVPADPRLRTLSGALVDDTLRATIEELFGVQHGAFARAEGDIETVVSDAPADASQPAALRGRVLLVEDNPVNRRVAQRLLDMHGLDVIAVGDGSEAISRLEREPYDLVLMDCLMPVMDGYTATRTWRERERSAGNGAHLPILAMTANAMAGDREKCLASGMDDYISKPLDRAGLVQLLKRWLPAGGSPVERASTPAPSPASEMPAEIPTGAFASAPPKTRAVNAAIIGDLLDTMGEEFGDLVRVYLEDAPQRIAEIETAASARDAQAQIAPAHTLKSSSANVGATDLSEFARRIEHAARAGILTEPAEIAEGVKREYERVAAELGVLIGRSPA